MDDHTLGVQLYDAAEQGNADKVLSLLSDNPGLNVNWGDYYHQVKVSLRTCLAKPVAV